MTHIIIKHGLRGLKKKLHHSARHKVYIYKTHKIYLMFILCNISDPEIPEVGKVYTVTNHYGCLMELNDGNICSGNEIVVSTGNQISFADSQQWYIKPVLATPHVYQIINYKSQMALDITDSKLRQQVD